MLKNIDSFDNSIQEDMFSSIFQPYIIGKIIKQDSVYENVIY